MFISFFFKSEFSCTCGGGDRSKCMKECSIADGSSFNDGDCACGSTSCNAASGYFCLASLNKCAKTKIAPACSNTDGSTANSETCSCGSSECDATKGLFCNAEYSACSKFPVCSNQFGSTINTGACSCGSSECDATKGLFCFASSSKCTKSAVGTCDGCENLVGDISGTAWTLQGSECEAFGSSSGNCRWSGTTNNNGEGAANDKW